jgi:hypothetical protein
MSNDKIPAQFVVKINTRDDDGKMRSRDFVLYAGLLAVAHDIGLTEISTELVQRADASNGNVAIVRATVKGKSGVFSAYGDASPASVNGKLVPALTRIAETRAKARGLRDFANINMVALEELGRDDVVDATPARRPQTPHRHERERGTELATGNQLRALWRKIAALGHQGDAIREFAIDRLGSDPTKATRASVSKLLDELAAEGRARGGTDAAAAE